MTSSIFCKSAVLESKKEAKQTTTKNKAFIRSHGSQDSQQIKKYFLRFSLVSHPNVYVHSFSIVFSNKKKVVLDHQIRCKFSRQNFSGCNNLGKAR